MRRPEGNESARFYARAIPCGPFTFHKVIASASILPSALLKRSVTTTESRAPHVMRTTLQAKQNENFFAASYPKNESRSAKFQKPSSQGAAYNPPYTVVGPLNIMHVPVKNLAANLSHRRTR